jgi:tripeptide aminopeptidase
MRAYERLLQYVQRPTGSDENNPNCPSTAAQLDFAAELVEELKSLGAADAFVDSHGYVYGTIPGNIPDFSGTTLGFIAHMDVVDEAPFENIRPRIIENYDGSVIELGCGLTIDPAEFPEVSRYVGETLIVTDGSTILGADDKAGIAEIMTMAEYFKTHPEARHGDIKIAFTPDEEIGRSADLFDVAQFGADFAYTADGAGFGEVEYENFNAASAKITVTGRSIHTGEAKNRMKNASAIAMELHGLLPEAEKPEHTEGYEGFYHLDTIEGHVESCTMYYLLRDHDGAKLQAKKDFLAKICGFINAKYGPGTAELEITDSYRNMAEMVLPHKHLLDNARAAIRELGGEPVSNPVRGGTDGARLSFMGLPCPNLGTGSHLHHGRQEFACVEAMDKCTSLLIKLAERYGEE